MALPQGTTITMSLAESLIAQGSGYRMPFRIGSRPLGTSQTSIAAGASAYISIRHSTHAIMLVGRELISDRSDVLYTVHRNPTIAQFGAEIPILPLNAERPGSSANTANIVAPSDVTDEGEEVDFGMPSAGGNPNTAGSPYDSIDFKVLPHDADFLLRIHNRGANAVNLFAMSLKWCELYPQAWGGVD